MRELALHLLDIAENSISARANRIDLGVEEDTDHDHLNMYVQDNGIGMDEQMVARVVDPFVTSRTTRKVGLGIPLLKAAAEACNGSLTIASTPGKGTRVDVTFQRSHIDRMPLGDIAATIFSLVIGSPQVNWVFRYRFDDEEFFFDDALIKAELNGVPMTEPGILTFILQMIYEGVVGVQKAANKV